MMTKSSDSNAYFVHKMELLKQCLSLSESLFGSLQDWKPLAELLSKREKVLQQLQKLENAFEEEAIQSCSQAEKSQIDHLVNLILAIDRDAAKLIREEQDKTIEYMKANTQGQKIVGYAGSANTQSGKYLDYKK